MIDKFISDLPNVLNEFDNLKQQCEEDVIKRYNLDKNDNYEGKSFDEIKH